MKGILKLIMWMFISFSLSFGGMVTYKNYTTNHVKLFKEGLPAPLAPYFMNFAFISGMYGWDVEKILDGLTIGFYRINNKDKADHTVAWCNYITKEIGFDYDIWQMLSEDQKFLIFFHEMGHCAFDRMHTQKGTDKWENLQIFLGLIKTVDNFEDGCPGSLMHPFMLEAKCIEAHAEEYLVEFFTKKE